MPGFHAANQEIFMFILCAECGNANGIAPQPGTCHICGGALPDIGSMINDGLGLLREGKYASFSISTSVPQEWLVREEDVWDLKVSGSRSIKDYLNGTISRRIASQAGMPYRADADCRLDFDMKTGRVSLGRGDMFVFGRYEKLAAGISQSRWACGACSGKGCPKCGGRGKNYESVEEKIGEPMKAECMASGYSLHASGREDVDALNTAGRPFVLSLKEPKNRSPDLAKVAGMIAAGNEVAVRDLKIVPRGHVELVTESHFDKEYVAEVSFGREIDEGDATKILSLSGKTLMQRTPERVAHRRADLTRNRRVLGMEILERNGGTATLRIKAEAGTYIKELISGDGGRTEPNISSMLGTKAECRKLTVSAIEDGFLGIFGL